MAVEPRSSSKLAPLAPDSAGQLRARPRRVDTKALAHTIPRRISVVVPIINLIEAALTYVFIVYVVPLPGRQQAHTDRNTLIAMGIITALAWAVCQLWGVYRCTSPARCLSCGSWRGLASA